MDRAAPSLPVMAGRSAYETLCVNNLRAHIPRIGKARRPHRGPKCPVPETEEEAVARHFFLARRSPSFSFFIEAIVADAGGNGIGWDISQTGRPRGLRSVWKTRSPPAPGHRAPFPFRARGEQRFGLPGKPFSQSIFSEGALPSPRVTRSIPARRSRRTCSISSSTARESQRLHLLRTAGG